MEGYLYETHLHTSEASACGRMTGAEVARKFKAAGYTGVVITDHFYGGNTAIDRSLPWKMWVEAFCKGYENAKTEGDKIGLQVFFGWEAGFQGTEFLIFGLDKQWLLSHPEIRDCSIERQYELVHLDGGMVIQAHPFREESYIKEVRLYPNHVDAVEAINATHTSNNSISHKNPYWNELAMEYAKKHDLPITCGSDQHMQKMIGGGMVFSRKLKDIHELCDAIRREEALTMLDGTQVRSDIEFF